MNTALTRRQSDHGFSLVELLVVIIIIGLLASIAIPLYLDQQKKGHDTAAKSDANAIAKLVSTFVTENDALPALTVSGRDVLLDGKSSGSLSSGVVLGPLVGTDITIWCLDVTHPGGDRAKTAGYKFTSQEQKVEEGQCA